MSAENLAPWMERPSATLDGRALIVIPVPGRVAFAMLSALRNLVRVGAASLPAGSPLRAAVALLDDARIEEVPR